MGGSGGWMRKGSFFIFGNSPPSTMPRVTLEVLWALVSCESRSTMWGRQQRVLSQTCSLICKQVFSCVSQADFHRRQFGTWIESDLCCALKFHLPASTSSLPSSCNPTLTVLLYLNCKHKKTVDLLKHKLDSVERGQQRHLHFSYCVFCFAFNIKWTDLFKT